MKTQCEKCCTKYDDTYRLTYCPHEEFEMWTVVINSDGEAIATTVEQLQTLMANK